MYDLDQDPDPNPHESAVIFKAGSAFTQKAGSGSALSQCGSKTLLKSKIFQQNARHFKHLISGQTLGITGTVPNTSDVQLYV
jgi:hypothetical protein